MKTVDERYAELLRSLHDELRDAETVTLARVAQVSGENLCECDLCASALLDGSDFLEVGDRSRVWQICLDRIACKSQLAINQAATRAARNSCRAEVLDKCKWVHP